jgi:phosphoglycerate dehydrogenase-like enzyme
VPAVVVSSALADAAAAPVAAALACELGRQVTMVPWRDGAVDGGLLLLAPHEWTDAVRAEVLQSADYSWVHLTSAGVDFVDHATWPADRLLTRSWRCYAAPLAEYAIHAVLSHEWRCGAPWTLADVRPAPGADVPPVPEDARPSAGLWGSRIGVAGWGAVGRRVATTLAAFGADVRVLRRSPEFCATPGITQTADIADVVDADHLVIALPRYAATRNLFDRTVLEKARAGLHLVNISRAELLDQDTLTRRCARGALAATLDVTDPEPLPAEHPLRHLPSVRLSPHVAWRSRASAMGFVRDLAEIWAALAGEGEVPGVSNGTNGRARAFVREQGEHR